MEPVFTSPILFRDPSPAAAFATGFVLMLILRRGLYVVRQISARTTDNHARILAFRRCLGLISLLLRTHFFCVSSRQACESLYMASIDEGDGFGP